MITICYFDIFTFFNDTFLVQTLCIMVRILLKLVATGHIDNSSTLAQILALRRTGDKPSPELMSTELDDSIWRH